MTEYLGDRRKALEESFFAKHEHKLREEIRSQKEKEDGMKALAANCGVTDAGVLEALVNAGIEPETLPALTLLPLVVVAWADGSVDPKERKAVLEAAEGAGISKSDAPYALLNAWLEVRPPENFMDAWEGYAGELRDVLDKEQRETVRRDIVERARSVADAAGGVLGLGSRISRDEKDVLKRIEAAL